MKKILILTTLLVMMSGVSCAEKDKKNTPEISFEPMGVEITQLVYKQEHLSFPDDMSQRMGLFYNDGVKFVYKSKNDEIKIMSYDENMNETDSVVIMKGDDIPHETACCTKKDGSIVMLCIYTDYPEKEITDYEDFAENAFVSPQIRIYSPNGELLETHEIDGFHSYEDLGYIDGFYEYGENYVLSFRDGFALIMADGEIFNINNDKQNMVFATDTEGKTYACDWKKYSVAEGLSVNSNIAKEYGKYLNRTGSVFRGEGGFKLFFVLNEGIFGLDYNDEFMQILDFTDSNVSPSGIYYACYGGEGKFVICGGDQTLADGMFFDILTVRPDDYVENKTDLTLGCIDWSNNAPEIAMMYSKQSDNYNVDIKKYEDIDNLKLDVLSGDAPDLFCYQETSFMYRCANMGAFANLYDFMENNDGIKQDDILENVLQAYEYKGGLYGIPIGFSLSGILLANSDVIGRENSYWNYEEFFSIAENMPEGMYLSPRNSHFSHREGVFDELCVSGYGNWVNYDNYTCDFNNEEFIHLLNFCNTVKINEPFDWEGMKNLSQDEHDIITNEDDISVQNKKSLFGTYTDYIHDCNDLIYTSRQNGLYLNGNYTYLIEPSNDRTGKISIANDMCFSILSNTECPEGAWDFMNYVLSPHFQNNYLQLKWHFTTNKESYNHKINKTLDEFKQQVITPLDPMENNWGTPETEGITWINKPITDEDAEYITEFLSHFNKLYDSDEEAQNIIREECYKFMNGETTAEKCAETIQNRVSIYLSEQS
ncbi:MAG: extracellular solute-binding protein [Ruminococcus sp.]|nr:extracellular solute-binding protein [Ruminococcus sp.]